jgi:hypothetical protein
MHALPRSHQEELTRTAAGLQPPFHRAAIGEEEIQAVSGVIRSGWMTMGPKTFEFEKKFAKYVGAQHTIAVSTGKVLGRLLPSFSDSWRPARAQVIAFAFLGIGLFSASVIIESAGELSYYITHLELRGFFFEGKGTWSGACCCWELARPFTTPPSLRANLRGYPAILPVCSRC